MPWLMKGNLLTTRHRDALLPMRSAFMLLKLMEGFGVKESYERVSKVFVPTYVAGSVFWPAANLFSESVTQSTSNNASRWWES
eukprot:352454-Chlamydomonas_euryale.AAC.2